MRKILKAAAMLTVGGALLSTSAFAALSGTAVYNASTGKIDVNVSGLGTGESTIMVLKSATAIDAIPSTFADADIVYIDQKTATADGTASYSIDPGTRGADTGTYYVFAGGTNETSATFLGAAKVLAKGVVIKEGSADAAETKELTSGQTAAFTAVVNPANATDTVTWTVKQGETDVTTSVLSVAADGVATFTAPVVAANTDYVVTATAGGVTDTVSITVKAATAPGRDFITTADTDKATFAKTVTLKNSSGAEIAIGGVSMNEVVITLNTTAYPKAGQETAGYILSVVDSEGNAVANASVLYSTQRKKYVALIPTTVSGYKFEVTTDGTANDTFVYGDPSGDKKVAALDISQIKAFLKSGSKGLTTWKKIVAADVSGDGKLAAVDVSQINASIKRGTALSITTK